MFDIITSLVLSVAQILIFGLIFYAIEFYSHKKSFKDFLHQEVPFLFNQLLFLLTNLIVVPRLIKLLVRYFFQFTGKTYVFDLNPVVPLWILILIVFVFADFWGYWAHRLFHQKLLWRFHYSHHSLPHIHWLNAFRFHPIEMIATSASLYMALSFLNISPYILQSYILVNTIFSMLAHTNCRWNFKILVSPKYHSVHHTTEGYNRNFGGVFTIWDSLFGTRQLESGPEVSFTNSKRDPHYLRNMLLRQKIHDDE